MEVASLVLAVAAIALTLGVDWLKRPKIEIRAVTWQAKTPVAWTFAAVRIYNRPLPRPLRSLFVRSAASCCEVTLEFREPGKQHLALPPVPARWSSQPEPLRSVLVADPSGSPSFVVQYDPALVPQARRIDVPAGDGGEELAVAILRADGSAHAWGAESYALPNSSNPEWELKRQVWDVTVRVRASGLSKSRSFRLENLAVDFATFSNLRAV